MSLAPLGLRAIVQLRNPQVATPKQKALYRGRTRRQVTTCTNCELHRHQPAGQAPVAFSSGRTPRFTVIGEAPGPEESKRGEPFVGPSGKLLRALMSDVGIDPTEDVLWANTVSCFPNTEGTIRPPNESETAFCRDNMLAQLEASYTNFALLVGAKALNAFRSDLAITKHHGRLFVWNETYAVMGIIHPAAALRGRKAFKGDIRRDLEVWVEIVWSGDDPLKYLGDRCIKCGEEMWSWDRDGVPYCKRHYDQWGKAWEKERLRWHGAKIEQLAF